jgi:hypothetical protein
MNNDDHLARPVSGSYVTIDGVEITEDLIAILMKNSGDGLPGATFRPTGRPSRTIEPTRANREHRSRSDAIRAALAKWANES